MQAIARTNRLCEGKDYGLIVDYRGLIKKLDTAMDLYSGAGLENFDGGRFKGGRNRYHVLHRAPFANPIRNWRIYFPGRSP